MDEWIKLHFYCMKMLFSASESYGLIISKHITVSTFFERLSELNLEHFAMFVQCPHENNLLFFPLTCVGRQHVKAWSSTFWLGRSLCRAILMLPGGFGCVIGGSGVWYGVRQLSGSRKKHMSCLFGASFVTGHTPSLFSCPPLGLI